MGQSRIDQGRFVCCKIGVDIEIFSAVWVFCHSIGVIVVIVLCIEISHYVGIIILADICGNVIDDNVDFCACVAVIIHGFYAFSLINKLVRFISENLADHRVDFVKIWRDFLCCIWINLLSVFCQRWAARPVLFFVWFFTHNPDITVLSCCPKNGRFFFKGLHRRICVDIKIFFAFIDNRFNLGYGSF